MIRAKIMQIIYVLLLLSMSLSVCENTDGKGKQIKAVDVSNEHNKMVSRLPKWRHQAFQVTVLGTKNDYHFLLRKKSES